MIAYRGVAKDGTLTASANDSIIDDLSFPPRLQARLRRERRGQDERQQDQRILERHGPTRRDQDVRPIPCPGGDTDGARRLPGFTFDTTRTRLADARFDGNWTTTGTGRRRHPLADQTRRIRHPAE